MIDQAGIAQRWQADGSKRDERGRRVFAASEVRAAGWGGLAAVSRITGLARSTIGRGLKDLNAPLPAVGRIRRKGGGPRPLTERDASLLADLERLVEPATRGDPERPLLWVSKSCDKLAAALRALGHAVSPNTVRKLLTLLGFSRQANRKVDEGSRHPDRNAQFEHLNKKVLAAQAAGEPVISVDTKKKELVGNYRNGGTDYRPKGTPRRVKVHDFEDKILGKVAPYGVYDVTADEAWVSVGITADTAQFAVQSIRTWLHRMARARYPQAKKLLITADCGGSNGSRVRLWKVELQKLADQTGLALEVCHYPPGTSKWNKIEHRLFCRITQNWRGQPLTDRMTVLALIGATTTRTGLKVECALDERIYQKGVKVSKAEIAALDITGDEFHPEGYYILDSSRPIPYSPGMAKNLLNNVIFQDTTKARQWLESLLWVNGRVCGYCGALEHSSPLKGREGYYQCKSCRKQFTVLVGTVFERSHIPLNKWLMAAFLLSASKKGISAHQGHRMLGITYKSAWFMWHRLREAMAAGTLPPLGGDGMVVEADETYYGDLPPEKAPIRKNPDRPKFGPGHKRAIVTLVERGGKARSFYAEKANVADVTKIVREHADKESRLHTDESRVYWKIGEDFAAHEAVNHGQKEWARGDVTTNTAEGFFSIFKRGMSGIYQHCSEQHLHRYLAEFDFRYNNRTKLGVNDVDRTTNMLKGIVGKRLTYRRINEGEAKAS